MITLSSARINVFIMICENVTTIVSEWHNIDFFMLVLAYQLFHSCNLLGLQICVLVLNATVFDKVYNVSWYFLCFPNQMCYPDSNNLFVSFFE